MFRLKLNLHYVVSTKLQRLITSSRFKKSPRSFIMCKVLFTFPTSYFCPLLRIKLSFLPPYYTQVSHGNYQWVIRRRYHHFRRLHTSLFVFRAGQAMRNGPRNMTMKRRSSAPTSQPKNDGKDVGILVSRKQLLFAFF